MIHHKKTDYLISFIICLAAVITLVITWVPVFAPLYISIPASTGAEVPMRIVGVNYPIISLIYLGVSFIAFLLIFFSLAQRRKSASRLFWLNSVSVSIIFSHIIMWLFLMDSF